MSFGQYLYAGGFIQKIALGPLAYTPNKQTDDNKWFYSRKLWKTTLEDSRRHHDKSMGRYSTVVGRLAHGEAAWPSLEPAHPLLPRTPSYDLLHWFYGGFRSIYPMVVEEEDTDRWYGTSLAATPSPPYIRTPRPPPGGHLSFRSRHNTKRIRARLSNVID
jgi:hypothetical protein